MQTDLPWDKPTRELPSAVKMMRDAIAFMPEGPAHNDALNHLNEQHALYHIEHLSWKPVTDYYGDWRRSGVVLHVYEDHIAFAIRMHFGLLPLREGWRKAFYSRQGVMDPNDQG